MPRLGIGLALRKRHHGKVAKKASGTSVQDTGQALIAPILAPMLELSRTVRFCLDTQGNLQAGKHNTYAAWPPPNGLARYFELRITCRGKADPLTGYFINIRDIDRAVRANALPALVSAAHDEHTEGPTLLGPLMSRLCSVLQPALNDSVYAVELQLTPFTSVALQAHDMPHRIYLKQRYEFSSAHRLHVDTLSDEENREVFGKCNNPAGHGHNYTIEVVARTPVDEHGKSLDIASLDRAVDQHVIDKLDHKHLNHDVPEFTGLNPSVENIAAVIWKMLDNQIPGQGSLAELSVWETGKTVCTYRGPESH